MRYVVIIFLLGITGADKELACFDKSDDRTFLIITMLILALAGSLLSIIMVAYLSMDELVLELKTKTGTDEEKEQVLFIF
jgi:hypothetical protein